MRIPGIGLLVPLLLLPAACAPTGRESDGDDDDTPGTPDASGPTQCDPFYDTTCVGSDLYTCNDDGSLGGLVTACGSAGCQGQSCGTPPKGDDCAESTQVIYAVDTDYNLLSFDPHSDAHTFTLIGKLQCPAGPSWPTIAASTFGAPATPFSMSVARDGRAWVQYSSGEIFLVSTEDASCTPSGFVKGSQGFEIFGMGFVTDTAGGDTETLYVAGGASSRYGQMYVETKLGKIAPASYATSTLGTVPVTEYSPELTGTGNGELWGYFPGGSGEVSRLDKVTGARLQTYPVPVQGLVEAWAFAHWGGRHYVFVSTTSIFGGPTNKILRLDPAGNGGMGTLTTVVPSSPYEVVGAGVSTCAPVVID